MGLIVPRWGFKHHASYYTINGQLNNDAQGSVITCGSANTKGSTASAIITATDFDVHCIAIGLVGNNLSGTYRGTLSDVMYDPAGGTSWSVLIANLIHGQTISELPSIGYQQVYIFPLYVKSGASFSIRSQSSTASAQHGAVIWVWGEPSNPAMWWCGQAVESLGPLTASSTGTAITASQDAYSSFQTIGTSTRPYGAYQIGIGPANDTTMHDLDVYVQVGVGGSRLPGSPTIYFAQTSLERRAYAMPMAIQWCDIPASTTFQGRIKEIGGAQLDNHSMCIYGVY